VTYLDGPRITFAGDFQADVSTVNNDVRHYDVETWEDRFQDPQVGGELNGWWNPTGSGAFRLVDCFVTGGLAGPAGPSTPTDPALTARLADAADRNSGKMVDLDPQWQMASCIWGLTIRLVGRDGAELLRGDLESVPFRDIFFGRQTTSIDSRSIQNAGAVFRSVLRVHWWGSGSPLVSALRAQTHDDLLSVRLTTFGYYTASTHPRFTLGRVVGVLGVQGKQEPHSFNLARRLVPTKDPAQVPVEEQLGFFDGALSQDHTSVTLDLSNALRLADPLGGLVDTGAFALGLASQTGGQPTVIGPFEYRSPGWLLQTSGLVTVRVPAALRDRCATERWVLLRVDKSPGVRASETSQGLHVRAENFTGRVDSKADGPVCHEVHLYAAKFGVPTSGLQVKITDVGPQSGLGGGPPNEQNPPAATIPVVNVPATAVTGPVSVQTGEHGLATIHLQVSSPGNPRGYLDGQIFLRAYGLDGLSAREQNNDLVVLHVRDAVTRPDSPTWADVQPLLTQFGRIYPVMMRRLVDLSSESDVLANAALMKLALSLPLEDPNHMPVTRDLSAGNRNLIIAWLDTAADSSVSIEDAQKAAGSRPVPSQVRLMVAADADPAAGRPQEPLPDIAGKDPFASQLRAAGLLDDGQLEEEEE
jgi:hypothetical protein